MLVLFSDTDTDMTPEIAKEYGYRLISMPYSVDGRNIYPYVDFEKFDCHEFYEMLRAGTIPNTSALNEEEYINYFKPVFEAGDDILYVHFSRQMSGTFAAMDRAVARLKAEYPERSFYAIDTRGISILSLNVALEIGDMYKAGKSVEEMLKWAETEVDKFAVYYFADDLRFLPLLRPLRQSFGSRRNYGNTSRHQADHLYGRERQDGEHRQGEGQSQGRRPPR